MGKLVLVSPIGLWRDDAPIRNWMIMARSELARLAFCDPEGPVAAELMALPEDPDERIEAQIAATWAFACTGKFIWPIPDKGLKKRLHRIAAPTLVVWGKEDKLVPPVYAEEFGRRITGARVELVERAAHVPHLAARGGLAPRARVPAGIGSHHPTP